MASLAKRRLSVASAILAIIGGTLFIDAPPSSAEPVDYGLRVTRPGNGVIYWRFDNSPMQEGGNSVPPFIKADGKETGLAAVVRAAVNKMNESIGAGIQLAYGPAAGVSDGSIPVSVSRVPGTHPTIAAEKPGTAAVTTTTCTAGICTAVIYINGDLIGATGDFDSSYDATTLNDILHEIGHVLGLDHASPLREAANCPEIMNYGCLGEAHPAELSRAEVAVIKNGYGLGNQRQFTPARWNIFLTGTT
ncbi:hypothetical protein [Streptomyces sp. NPDC005533]|uniref:hypothetical protein n=1 Tax=Streptomyces sp. NPDC005533 TaxID=3364723 RepID=UPI00368F2F74